MALPITSITWPSNLRNFNNGSVELEAQLQLVPGEAGGPDLKLWPQSARAHRAMIGRAKEAGITLKATSAADSFRSFAIQHRIFHIRYSTSGTHGGCKVCAGIRYCKRLVNGRVPATAACPGTSNHGWGLAVDYGEELDGDAGTESISKAAVNWLVHNAHHFGISAELQSEPWHWRYVAGDNVPKAVLDFEANSPFIPPALPPSLPKTVWQQGDRDAHVRNIQHAVNVVGCGPINEDSIFGPRTTTGVKCVQRKAGVRTDGRWGPVTDAGFWNLVRAQSSSRPTLRRGARGEHVTHLQRSLHNAGFGRYVGGIDGIFGPNTERAVRAFQGSVGIASDGIVGLVTWGRLG